MPRVQVNEPGNHFIIGPISGLLSGVAAGTASAGHVFAARWNPPVVNGADKKPRYALITRFRARWQTIVGPTAGQEVGLDASIVRGYTASHSGGTAIAIPTLANGNTNKKWSVSPISRAASADSVMADLRIAAAAALTNGTETFDATPFGNCAVAELASGAAIQVNGCEIYKSSEDLAGRPIKLAPNEGIVVRNRIAMGAALLARLIIELEWDEVDE